MRSRIIALSAVLLLAGPVPALAHDVTDVATMLEKGNPYDARLSVGFRTTLTTGALNREYMGNFQGVEIVRDLIYKQTKMELDLKAEFAIFKNLAIYVRLPVILKQQNTYNFAGGSRYPGYPQEPQCQADHPNNTYVCNPDGVNSQNSRTVQDGIATGLSGIDYVRVDPNDPNSEPVGPPPQLDLGQYAVSGGEAGPRTLFKGPNRSGIDQLHIGLHWLVHGFKQKDDSTKPNWRIGTEFRLSVGKIMDFKRGVGGDPSPCGAPSRNNWACRPDLNDAVGRGIHEIRFYTTVSKRLWILDSFMHFYFQMPMAYRNNSFYRSKYDFSDAWGEEDESPVNKAPKIAGIRFGTEVVAWEKPQDHFKFVVTLVGIIDYVFPGRHYTEAYELLAGSPPLNMNCPSQGTSALYDHMCRDSNVRENMMYYPGLTDQQDYAIFGGSVGFDFLIYKYVKLQFNYTLMHHQEHFLTNTDAGLDTGTDALQGGTCPSGAACSDGRVNIPSREQNPWHRPAIDTPGHRYRMQEMLVHQIWLNLQFRF